MGDVWDAVLRSPPAPAHVLAAMPCQSRFGIGALQAAARTAFVHTHHRSVTTWPRRSIVVCRACNQQGADRNQAVQRCALEYPAQRPTWCRSDQTGRAADADQLLSELPSSLDPAMRLPAIHTLEAPAIRRERMQTHAQHHCTATGTAAVSSAVVSGGVTAFLYATFCHCSRWKRLTT